MTRKYGVATNWGISSFKDPAWHAEIADVVRRNSMNLSDVREVALQGLDLKGCRSVLDLGCGFGFMTEAAAPRCASDAHIVGIDACPSNADPYLQCIERAGRAGEFLCRRLEKRLDWPDRFFDLVVPSYSLYFFPGTIPEIARVLDPGGVFIALTHSEESIRDLIRLFGAHEDHSSLLLLSRNFSAENGVRFLASRFRSVESVKYENTLVFGEDRKQDFLAYLRFKMPFLDTAGDLERVWRSAQSSCQPGDQITLAKNDAIFRCRKPVIP